jgi:hypothetical protein
MAAMIFYAPQKIVTKLALCIFSKLLHHKTYQSPAVSDASLILILTLRGYTY